MVHYLFRDGSTACGQRGMGSAFIVMVNCPTCTTWYDTNEFAKKYSPQFNETLVFEMVECTVCPHLGAADEMVWFGSNPVCPVHAQSYRDREAKHGK